MIASLRNGAPAGGNPWEATSLEWQTPDTPPCHGNWGEKLPVVYRWAYEYGVPGVKDDFVPQNIPPEEVVMESGAGKYIDRSEGHYS
jgi:cytochrome c oxidase subunit 1